MIKAVVFDVGGVLTTSPVDEFTKVDVEHGLPAGTAQSFFRGGESFQQVETGQLPVAEFYQRCSDTISTDHGVRVPVERLQQMLEACMGTSLRPEMLSLVERVKAAGYQTGLLTNIFAERRGWLHSLLPAGVIDVYCDSSEVGLRKPEPPIYLLLLRMLGLAAPEVVLIDDFSENVATALELGFATILFQSSEQTFQALAAHGVSV